MWFINLDNKKQLNCEHDNNEFAEVPKLVALPPYDIQLLTGEFVLTCFLAGTNHIL